MPETMEVYRGRPIFVHGRCDALCAVCHKLITGWRWIVVITDVARSYHSWCVSESDYVADMGQERFALILHALVGDAGATPGGEA